MLSTNAVQMTEEEGTELNPVIAFVATYSRLILVVFCCFWGVLTVCIWATKAAHSWQRSLMIVSGSAVITMPLLTLLLLCLMTVRTKYPPEFPEAEVERYLFIVFLAVCAFIGFLVFGIAVTITPVTWERAAGILAGLILIAVIAFLAVLMFFNESKASLQVPREVGPGAAGAVEGDPQGPREVGPGAAGAVEGDPQGHGGSVQEDTGKSEIQPAVSVRTRRGESARTPMKSGPLVWKGKGTGVQNPKGSEKDGGAEFNGASIQQNLDKDGNVSSSSSSSW